MKKIIYLFVLISFFVNGNTLKAQGNAAWTLGQSGVNEDNPISAKVPGTDDIVIAYQGGNGNMYLSRFNTASGTPVWPNQRAIDYRSSGATDNAFPTAIYCDPNSNAVYVAVLMATKIAHGENSNKCFVSSFNLDNSNLNGTIEISGASGETPHIRNIHVTAVNGSQELIATGLTCSNHNIGNHLKQLVLRINIASFTIVNTYFYDEFENEAIYNSLINSSGNLICVGYHTNPDANSNRNRHAAFIKEFNLNNNSGTPFTFIRNYHFQPCLDNTSTPLNTAADRVIERININGKSEYYVACVRNSLDEIISGYSAVISNDIIICKLSATNNGFSLDYMDRIQENAVSDFTISERCMFMQKSDNNNELIICGGRSGSDRFIISYNLNLRSVSGNWNYYNSKNNLNNWVFFNDLKVLAVGTHSNDILIKRIERGNNSNYNEVCGSQNIILQIIKDINNDIVTVNHKSPKTGSASYPDLSQSTTNNSLSLIYGCGQLCQGKIQIERTGCGTYSIQILEPNGIISKSVWTLNGKYIGETSSITIDASILKLGPGNHNICVKYFAQNTCEPTIADCCTKCSTLTIEDPLTSNDQLTYNLCFFGDPCVPYKINKTEKFRDLSWVSYSLNGANKTNPTKEEEICLPLGTHEINYYDIFGCLIHTRLINIINSPGGQSSICEDTIYTCDLDKEELNIDDMLPNNSDASDIWCPDCYKPDAVSQKISKVISLPTDNWNNHRKWMRTIRNYETCNECTFVTHIINKNCDFTMPELLYDYDPVTKLIKFRWKLSNEQTANLNEYHFNLSIGGPSQQNLPLNQEFTISAVSLYSNYEFQGTICRKVCENAPLCCKPFCFKIVRIFDGNREVLRVELLPCDGNNNEGGNSPSTPESPQPAPLEAETALKIVPNPTTSVFRIVPDQAGEAAATYKTVRVFDATGKQVMEKTDVNSNTWFDISALNPGIYLVKTTFNEKEVVLRVMRQDD